MRSLLSGEYPAFQLDEGVANVFNRPRMVAELYTPPGQLMTSAVLASLQALAITLGEIISGAAGRAIGFIKWQITVAFAIAGVLFAGR